MNNKKYQVYIEMIEKESSTVGVKISENIEIEDRIIPLQKITFDIAENGEVPEKYNINIEDLKRNLRAERNDLKARLEECQVENENEARNIVNKIKEIDRSLSLITDTDEIDLSKKIKRNEAVKVKKWRNFLKKIKGEDDNEPGRR